MNENDVYIHDFEGLFPGANNIQDFWRMIENGDVAPLRLLDEYWGEQGDAKSDELTINVGHILQESLSKSEARQVTLGKKVLQKLYERLPSKARLGLIVATEWTDPSFYEAELGDLDSKKSYNVEKQLKTLGESIDVRDRSSVLAVDTACASGIYAVYVARDWLDRGDYDYVIVLGLNAYLHRFLYKGFSKLGALSATKKLSSFSKLADGIVPGESVCAVALSSEYERAIAEVNGIGLSCDGREGSAFSPSFNGQLEAYRRAYRESSVSKNEIAYIEAHGTATKLGDETELKSINRFFAKDSQERPIYIGASKSNFGHTLAASGVLAMIKAALMINKNIIPPLKIDGEPSFDESTCIRSISHSTKYSGQKLHIGISSFGFGGSNGHMVLSPPIKKKIEKTNKRKLKSKELFLYDYESLNAHSLLLDPGVVDKIPLGPKMQKRLDSFQRHAIALTSKIIRRQNLSKEKMSELGCIFMNNLGGQLSIDFARQSKDKEQGPSLTLEAVSSTLPSMLSGNIAQVFDLRGTHMLLSSSFDGVSQALETAYSYSKRHGRPVLLGMAHKNFSRFDSDNEGMAVFLISDRPDSLGMNPCASMKIEQRDEKSVCRLSPMAEASGLAEILEGLDLSFDEQRYVNLSSIKLEIKSVKQNDNNKLFDLIGDESDLNKNILLDYLVLKKNLERTHQGFSKKTYGEVLKDLSCVGDLLKATLVVPESHKYFYDHPLDHVPGIAVVHGSEELINWRSENSTFPSKISIRFKKFIEKDLRCYLEIQAGAPSYKVSVTQSGNELGHMEIQMRDFHLPENEEIEYKEYEKEHKRITHKHNAQNVLVSALNPDLESCTALPLEYVGHKFFEDLMSKRPSLLYYLEVTRQFVMLMAHLVKKIPLESKMNLIAVDVEIQRWVKPPFELNLVNFTIQNTEAFSLANIEVEYRFKGERFGAGTIKAQVVDKEYYDQQRKGVKS